MSAASIVEKATSDMLIGPDWALNLDLCDVINNDPSQSKDVVKAVKKRLANRNAQIQLLALTVLETLIKNCGDHVHQQVAEKDVLHEMVKIVKKKADMRVRDKILVLLDSWQEAFGGSKGRYPQYYMAYNELQKAGVEFPRRGGEHTVPIFTPPQSQPISSPYPPLHSEAHPRGLSSPRAEADENLPGMSLTDIQSSRGLIELLSEMLSALPPRDRMAAKAEVIVELVDQCRISQRRVMQLVNDTSDEELLRQGLALNDDLQRVIGRHDAILSGSPLPEREGVRSTHNYHDEEEPEDDVGHLSLRNQPRTQASQLVPGTTAAKSTHKLPQLAIPPPPGSTKKPLPTSVRTVFGSSSARSSPVDLLSGDFIANQSPPTAAPAPSAPVDQNQARLDLLALPAPEGPPNPFGSASFQATPSNPPPPSYGGTLQSQSPQIHGPEEYQREQQLGRTQSQPVGNSYAAPWSQAAIEAGNVLSAQQHAAIYGEVHSSLPQSPSGHQQPQGQPTQYFPQSQSTVTTPPPWQEDPQPQAQQQPWTGGYQAPYPSWGGANGPQPWNSQQQPARSYSLPWTAESGTASFPNQSNQIQQYQQSQVGQGPGDNFGSQYLQQRGSQYGQPSALGPSQPQGVPSKSVKSSDMLFDDLVDLRSVNAKLKATGIHDSMSRSNTSKAGPLI